MVGVGFVEVTWVNFVTFGLLFEGPWEGDVLAFALLVASSLSGTMALIAAWKASSSDVSDGFLAVFDFDVEGRSREWSDDLVSLDDSFSLGNRFGLDRSDGSVDSTVSSHGFVFTAFMCACCLGVGRDL